MFKNFLLTSLRNISRQKSFTFINILGLAVGLACSFMIHLYITNELAYDTFYPQSENIYRLCITNNIGDKIDTYCNAPRPTSPTMKEIYPEVIEQTRAVGVNGLYTHSAPISYERQTITTDEIFAVDSTFFGVFENEFIYGNADNALNQSNTIVLTESFAQKLFGNENPLDKTVTLNNRDDMLVTGVIKNHPAGTHFRYEALVPWSYAYRQGEEGVWYGWHSYHYIKLAPQTDHKELEAKFPEFFTTYMKDYYDGLNGSAEMFLQPLESIHLHSNVTWEMYANNDIANIYIFASIAVFLIVIASINYMNLSTARANRRSKEITIRKIVGSRKRLLIIQFIVESIFIAFLAFLISIILIELFSPLMRAMLPNVQNFKSIFSVSNIILLFIVSLCVGMLSGIYPATVIAGFSPMQVMKSNTFVSKQGFNPRKVLIFFQFAISIILIICTLVVVRQLSYARNFDLGFDKDNVIFVMIRDPKIDQNARIIRDRLRDLPFIESTSIAYDQMGTTFNRFPARLESNEGEIIQRGTQFMQIDYDFLKTMKINIVKGRDFDRERDQFWYDSFIVNQALVNAMGWEEPLGKRYFAFADSSNNPTFSTVAGVMDDFISSSIHSQVFPLLAFLVPENGQEYYGGIKCLFVRYKQDQSPNVLATLRDMWIEYGSESPPEYHYLDENLNQQYQEELNLLKLFGYFTILAIFIACLGLLGLSSYSAEQKIREIGIRRVLGSTANQVVVLLTKQFLILVASANIIAWPVAFFIMRKWLENFAYRASLSVVLFILSALIALLIALLTVIFYAYRAANINPAKALKYE
jgi:putative ABC transport system permease protein